MIESIVSQHAEEAVFLWLLREGTIAAPHSNLAAVVNHDDRIEAQSEYLQIDGAEIFN